MKSLGAAAILGVVLLGTAVSLGVSRVNAQEEGTTTPAEIATSTDGIIPPLDATEGSSTPEASTTESLESTTTPDFSWWPFHFTVTNASSTATTTLFHSFWDWFHLRFGSSATGTDASNTDDSATTTPSFVERLFNFWLNRQQQAGNDVATSTATTTAPMVRPQALRQRPQHIRRDHISGVVVSVGTGSITLSDGLVPHALKGVTPDTGGSRGQQTVLITADTTISALRHGSTNLAKGDMVSINAADSTDGAITARTIIIVGKSSLVPH
jgi:hypothetical protein